jgi:hypothetical protein
MPFKITPRSYVDVASSPPWSPSTHARFIIPASALGIANVAANGGSRDTLSHSDHPPDDVIDVQIPLSSGFNKPTKRRIQCRIQPQQMAKDRYVAEKVAEAPPSPQMKKFRFPTIPSQAPNPS